MSCLTDSIVDPPHLHFQHTAKYAKYKEQNKSVIPLNFKQFGAAQSIFSFFNWHIKHEAGDVSLQEDSVDAVSYSVDPCRRANTKRGPSPPVRAPSPPLRAPSPSAYFSLGKLNPLLARGARCPSESDVDKGLKKVDTNIDTGRDENAWLSPAYTDAKTAGSHDFRAKNRRLDVGDSVDRRGSFDSLSYAVDARSSVSNVSETSDKDWEPHEADSMLSEIYDLGDDCICLMHPCICNLDENSFPEPETKSYGKRKLRSPRKHLTARIRQREKEQAALMSSPVDRKELEGTSTDLHYFSSSKHASLDGQVGEEKVKLSEKVIRKKRFSPYNHGTDVDPNNKDEPEVMLSMSNRAALLLKDSGLPDDSVDGDVTALSCMYSYAVDAGDRASFVKSLAAQTSMVDTGLNTLHDSQLKSDMELHAAAHGSTFSVVNVATGPSSHDVALSPMYPEDADTFVTTTSQSDRATREAPVTGKSASQISEEEQMAVHMRAMLMTPELQVNELDNDLEKRRSPDVTYDDSMGDSAVRTIRQPSYRTLPRMLDVLGFGADRVSSSNVDDVMAEDNGAEPSTRQGRELRLSDFMPDDNVDGCVSSTDQYSDGCYGMSVDGSPNRSSPPRRCRSDPDMQGSKTDPDRVPASYPANQSHSRSSRIPRRVLKPGGKTSEQNLPSQQEQKQQRSPKLGQRDNKPRQPDRQHQSSDSTRPPSEAVQDAAPASRQSRLSLNSSSPVSPVSDCRHLSDHRSRDHVSCVITTDHRSKPYVPQVITFYTHKDSKVATTIPPPLPSYTTPAVKTPELPPWNPSTLVEKNKTYLRPQPLHYKRPESGPGAVSPQGQGMDSKQNLEQMKEDDAMYKVSAYLDDMSTSRGDQSHTTSTASISVKSPNKKPPLPKHPFRPAGLAFDKRRQVPPSNTARSIPDLRVPGKIEIPVVYPSMKSSSVLSTKCMSPNSSESKSREEVEASECELKRSFYPDPDCYHSPTCAIAATERQRIKCNCTTAVADSNNNRHLVEQNGHVLKARWNGMNTMYRGGSSATPR